MSMTDWAKREVEIACKKERESSGVAEGWDYGCACYESALKAYNSLMEDGHSGMSIGLTKQILMRLIDGKPLTPIEDIDGIWEECGFGRGEGSESYQCKRMSSLFKCVYPDGRVEYSDVDRFVAFNIGDDWSYHSGLVDRVVGEIFPITMPYIGETYKVYTEDFLTDPKNGDFDTKAIFYCITPDGEKVDINRYFKDAPTESGWKEIDLDEFLLRRAKDEVRRLGGK